MVLPDECPEAIPRERERCGEFPCAAASVGEGGKCTSLVSLAGSTTASDDIEEGLLGFGWVSAAHGSGNGVCVSSGSSDEPLLRGGGGTAGPIRVVSEEQ